MADRLHSGPFDLLHGIKGSRSIELFVLQQGAFSGSGGYPIRFAAEYGFGV